VDENRYLGHRSARQLYHSGCRIALRTFSRVSPSSPSTCLDGRPKRCPGSVLVVDGGLVVCRDAADQPVIVRLWRRAMPAMASADPWPRRRQSRRTLQTFIEAKACSTRARTLRWAALWTSFHFRGPEQGRDLPDGQVGAPVRRDQQHPALESQLPGPTLERRLGALTAELADQLGELAGAEPAEQLDYHLVRCTDHTRHAAMIPCAPTTSRPVPRSLWRGGTGRMRVR
jgi:hypothetical protein